MKTPNPINETELIQTGKELIENGFGAGYVYKWIRERVPDQGIRERIMSQITAKNNPANTIQTPANEAVIKDRNLRNAKYIFQDFLESIEQIKTVGYIHILFGGLLLLSYFIFGGNSWSQAILSLFVGVVLFQLSTSSSLKQRSTIILIATVYLLVVISEFLLLGLPDKLIPHLGEFESVKFINIVTIANDLTPVLYFGIKLALVYYFVKVLFSEKKVSQLSSEMKMKVGYKY